MTEATLTGIVIVSHSVCSFVSFHLVFVTLFTHRTFKPIILSVWDMGCRQFHSAVSMREAVAAIGEPCECITTFGESIIRVDPLIKMNFIFYGDGLNMHKNKTNINGVTKAPTPPLLEYFFFWSDRKNQQSESMYELVIMRCMRYEPRIDFIIDSIAYQCTFMYARTFIYINSSYLRPASSLSAFGGT